MEGIKMTNRQRMALSRVRMPELPPDQRRRSNEEVNQGLTPELAMQEAARCLNCHSPSCITGCPVAVPIPVFIKHIEAGRFAQAAATLKEANALPTVCGRVCPQEKQCEAQCIHWKMKKEPVAIGYLERFASDWERDSGQLSLPPVAPPNGIKVAVAGSGPAALSFAGDMVKRGYGITVFEALHQIGGVLKYGIPAFRLPNSIVDHEIELLRKMGVRFVTNCIIGKTLSLVDLRHEGYKAIFIASGAGLPSFLHIPGENLNGVLSSNEYLTRVNLMDAANPNADTPVFRGKNVAVIGGGNTAMDAVRTAVRLGAERAIIIYRRTENEMPARQEEIRHAKDEGVEFLPLHSPIEYIGDEQGRVKQLRLQQMTLGEPDASGRRSPVPIDGNIRTIDADQVIVSVGVAPNPLIPAAFKGLTISHRGTIIVDNNTMRSALPDVYAGGDIVRGGATVILAMGDGKRAAEAMHRALTGQTNFTKWWRRIADIIQKP